MSATGNATSIPPMCRAIPRPTCAGRLKSGRNENPGVSRLPTKPGPFATLRRCGSSRIWRKSKSAAAKSLMPARSWNCPISACWNSTAASARTSGLLPAAGNCVRSRSVCKFTGRNWPGWKSWKPALEPGTRYFWLVKSWDAAGKPYAVSAISWWETGLLQQEAWRASWIGYETAEEAAVRHAESAWITSPDAKTLAAEKSAEQRLVYRQTITLSKPVRRAALYATGQDTVSAWVNGAQVLTADKFSPWEQIAW